MWSRDSTEDRQKDTKLASKEVNIETTVENKNNNNNFKKCPITSWQIDGEAVTDFILLGSKITADCEITAVMKLKDACSLEEKL